MRNFGIRNQNLNAVHADCAWSIFACWLSQLSKLGGNTQDKHVYIYVHAHGYIIYMHTQYTHNACVHIYMRVFIQILILESMCHTEASSSSHNVFLASQHFIFTSSWVRTTATNVNTFTNLFNPITIAKMASELLPLYTYQREFTFCLLFSSLLP